MKKVAVIGLGRLGLPLAALLADAGLVVTGVDKNPDVVEQVGKRRVPERIHEPGLQELLTKGGGFITTTDTAEAANSEASIILVPTPSEGDGEFSLVEILDVCEKLGEALRCKDHYHVVVIASTVSPGSCGGPIRKALERTSGKVFAEGFGLCYCPEFVALGNVIEGFRHPDFVLIGESDKLVGTTVARIYESIHDGARPFLYTSLINAEIAKTALNCYVAMKIVFANEMAELCESLPGAHVDVVTRVLGMDSRIAPGYLKGAAPFGGECFPRDTAALIQAMHKGGVPLLPGVAKSNKRQTWRLTRLVEDWADKIGARTIGMLGLAFKPGTSSIRGSMGVALVERLNRYYDVLAFDPIIRKLGESRTAQECVDRSDLIVVTIPCSEFTDLAFRRGQVVIDCWRILDGEALRAQGVEYVAIGVGPCEES